MPVMLDRFEQFSAMITSVYRNIQKIEREEMEKYGYKGAFAQYLVAMVRSTGDLTAARLCELCDKDKAAVSRVLSDMERMGLVVRQGIGEGLYKAKIVLTTEGKRMAEHVCRCATMAVQAGGKGLSDADRALFYAVFDQIETNLENVSREGFPQMETVSAKN